MSLYWVLARLSRWCRSPCGLLLIKSCEATSRSVWITCLLVNIKFSVIGLLNEATQAVAVSHLWMGSTSILILSINAFQLGGRFHGSGSKKSRPVWHNIWSTYAQPCRKSTKLNVDHSKMKESLSNPVFRVVEAQENMCEVNWMKP